MDEILKSHYNLAFNKIERIDQVTYSLKAALDKHYILFLKNAKNRKDVLEQEKFWEFLGENTLFKIAKLRNSTEETLEFENKTYYPYLFELGESKTLDKLSLRKLTLLLKAYSILLNKSNLYLQSLKTNPFKQYESGLIKIKEDLLDLRIFSEKKKSRDILASNFNLELSDLGVTHFFFNIENILKDLKLEFFDFDSNMLDFAANTIQFNIKPKGSLKIMPKTYLIAKLMVDIPLSKVEIKFLDIETICKKIFKLTPIDVIQINILIDYFLLKTLMNKVEALDLKDDFSKERLMNLMHKRKLIEYLNVF